MNFAAAQEEISALLRSFERRPHHVFHVAELAVQLFYELLPLHGLGERERLLLEAAAFLHDLGRATDDSGKDHHKESARLIREHRWQSFTPGEVAVIAEVARYHRKSLPQATHEDFAALSPMDQATVEILAALLRIADGLDRTHRGLVTRVKAEIAAERITLHLYGSAEAQAEQAGGKRKSDLAENLFRREVVVVLHPTPG
jgi:exopolyphosphatase/guanosine-5'-triphosphate,3'-diphosphate pyrophosphatase